MIGRMKWRVAFAKRAAAADGYGNEEGGFVDQFSVAAEIKPLRGGETVLAARLSGTQPVVIRVRRSSETRQITTGWRGRDEGSGAVYNITAVADMEGRGRFLDLMATAGVAAG